MQIFTQKTARNPLLREGYEELAVAYPLGDRIWLIAENLQHNI
jgi:hypothetical protein